MAGIGTQIKWIAIFLSLVAWPAHGSVTPAPRSCVAAVVGKSAYNVLLDIRTANARYEKLDERVPQVSTSYGSKMPILHSFEKEGLIYSDIAVWFPSLRETPGFESKLTPKEKLAARFAKEKTLSARERKFTRWLNGINFLEGVEAGIQSHWKAFSTEERLQFLLALKDPFKVLTVGDRETLFDDEVLNYNDIQPGPNAPPYMVVGDDLGSYEVRMGQALADRIKYLELRDKTEELLESSIGHKHHFHAWPTDASAREKIAPQYVELLDSTNWFLFWRQMKRDPDQVDSILTHPYLGVYTRSSLNRLHKAMVDNQPKSFNNKFRMLGARAFKANPDAPEQAGQQHIVDWEARSGMKSQMRDFVTDMIEARISSGDYSGLRDFRDRDFDPSAPIEQILEPFMTPDEIAVMAKFQERHPAMAYSPHANSHNHVRNRILAPLLRWQDRLAMPLKEAQLIKQQQKYAAGLLEIAKKFLRKLESGGHDAAAELGELRGATVAKLEEQMYQFARIVRLDEDFQRYLWVAPTVVPEITVASSGPLDVNAVPLGLEFSHRFPIKPLSKADAAAKIEAFASALREQFGTKEPLELVGGNNHGHGAIVKFKVTDQNGDRWRVEWDGISRYYVGGKIRRAWGGHAEVPTPRFTPQSIDDGIRDMFVAARSVGMVPRRSAGGGHLNVDIEDMQKNLPAKVGARGAANFIAYTESNMELSLFMWTHPLRKHATHQVQLQPGFAEAISKFRGNWLDLGLLLYEQRYFNTYVGRKPKYTPWNFTPLMTPILPGMYKNQNLDIRNKKQKWFPHFGAVTGRFEGRLFDAPLDEYMAALQLKYVRALLNKTFNSSQPLALKKRFTAAHFEIWKNNPARWIADAEAHLVELGLDPTEFKWLLWESYLNRVNYDERPQEYEIYDEFLPAVDLDSVGRFFWPQIEAAQLVA